MVEASAPSQKSPKDRSPSFPFIPLQAAAEKLAAFESYFGRHPTPAAKAGLAWKMKEKSSQSDQTLAALRSFGLVEYRGMGATRQVTLTSEGRNYLRAQQDSVKKQILKQCALRPKIIRKFWTTWGADRPPNAVALDHLAFDSGFSQAGAAKFLNVYDDTISFAGLSSSDKIPDETDYEDEELEDAHDGKLPPPRRFEKEKLMASERELTTGLLSRDASFRLIVNGQVGVKEIERLIAKLQLDKEILADESEETEPEGTE